MLREALNAILALVESSRALAATGKAAADKLEAWQEGSAIARDACLRAGREQEAQELQNAVTNYGNLIASLRGESS